MNIATIILVVGWLVFIVAHRLWRIKVFGHKYSSVFDVIDYTFALEEKYPTSKREILGYTAVTALLFMAAFGIFAGVFTGKVPVVPGADKCLLLMVTSMLATLFTFVFWRKGRRPFPRPFLITYDFALMLSITAFIS